jgi:hypothetical protein
MMGKTGYAVRSLSLRTLVVLLIATSSPLAFAKKRFVLDFDGTIVNDRGPDAGWKTYWTLKRIESLHSGMQPLPQSAALPPTIDISYAEYRRLMPLLGKGEAQVGDLQTASLDKDPLYPQRPTNLIPGYYRVSNDISYRRFRPGLEGENWLLSDLKDAVARQEQSRSRLKWRGPAFPLLTAAQPDELVLFSARAHTDAEFAAFMDALLELKEIKSVTATNPLGQPVRARSHFLNDAESIVFGRGLAEKKAKVPAEEAAQLLTGPFKKHIELHPDEYRARNGETLEMHLLVVAEDDPRYVAAVTPVLEQLSADLHYSQNIKFVLFNAGDAEEIAASRWKHRWTVFDRGFGREALVDEVSAWTGIQSQKTCKELLASK